MMKELKKKSVESLQELYLCSKLLPPTERNQRTWTFLYFGIFSELGTSSFCCQDSAMRYRARDGAPTVVRLETREPGNGSPAIKQNMVTLLTWMRKKLCQLPPLQASRRLLPCASLLSTLPRTFCSSKAPMLLFDN
jgi:hypothetical protein